MKKILMVSMLSVVAVAGTATAGNILVWGQPYVVEEPHPMSVEVGFLSDAATRKHRMNYVKLKNGHMMAVVPMDDYMAMAKPTGPDDMLQ